MRYANINYCECTNGLGWGISLYTQGCSRRCEGCFNPSTWDPARGESFNYAIKKDILATIQDKPFIERFSVLGGEPLEDYNLRDLSALIGSIRLANKDIKIWVFSGYTWEELQKRAAESNNLFLSSILENIDVLVDGPFVQEKKDISLKFAGSSNQRIIDVQKTLCRNGVCLLGI